MELLESEDSKRHLLRKSASQKAAIEEEVNLLSARTEKILINALVIGGALAISYLLVRQVGKKSRKKKVTRIAHVASVQPDEVEEESQGVSKFAEAITGIGTMVASQATAFLLALAKEKIVEFLQEQQSKAEKDDHS
jgi:hypothetical protein